MDIFTLEAVVRELQGALIGSRVNKVHQPAATDLLLRLWTGSEELRLMISCSPAAPCLSLTKMQFPNPFTPPRFCQLLRARLNRLTAIAQVPGERVVRIAFLGPEGETYTLVAELFGRQSNLLLVDGDDRVVDALNRQSGTGHRREILPGVFYRLPPARDLQSLGEALPEVPPTIGTPQDFRSWLLQTLTPMTPLVATDLAAAVAGGQNPQQVLADFRRRWLRQELRPTVGLWQGGRVLSMLPLERVALAEAEVFPSVFSAVDRFYALQSGQGGSAGVGAELAEAIRRQRRRLQSRLAHLGKEQATAMQSEEKRQQGELLLANLHRLQRGMEKVVLENWYADPPRPVTILLDPRLSPQENAERCFRSYKKSKRGIEHIERRLAETHGELVWLEETALALEEVETPVDLLALRLECEEAGLVPAHAEPAFRKRGPDPAAQLRQGRSPGGFALFWGKNSRTNDYVSRRLTESDDLWFHAHNLPGCHLVLKRPSAAAAVPEADILFAAAIAAAHSRGKEAGKVEVMVAAGGEVRKPKGARPGLVSVRHYRTVMVRPHDPAAH